MKKKELWMALSAVGVAATTSVAAPERAGVTGRVNPTAEQLSNTGSRVLFVGSDIFRNEVIRTDKTGQAHLLFLDQSSLTVGPDSELTLDTFVYDPKTNSGELTMTSTKGLLRFVGGAVSKTGGVTLKTPVGNLGLRGAVVLIYIEGPGGPVTAILLYGDEVTGTSNSGNTYAATGHGTYIVLKEDGSIDFGSVSPELLEGIIAKFKESEGKVLTTGDHLTLPDALLDWLEEHSTMFTTDGTLDWEDFIRELELVSTDEGAYD